MDTTSEPITVTISHSLGRDGAKQRIDSGLDSIRADIARYVKVLDFSWEGYRLRFRLSAMFQTITGEIDVYEDFVKVELGLPRLLHLVAKNILGSIEKRATTLLEGPKPRS